MADNYLEKRYEEVFGKGSGKTVRKVVNPSLNSLLLKNRSHRSFSHSHIVTDEALRDIIAVNSRIASAMNQQVLRFRPVSDPVQTLAISSIIRLGAALPQEKLPPPGAEPPAYIVVCSTVEENRWVDIDLGISLEAMSLKAVELGLNATIVGSFDRDALRRLLDADNMHPLALLAVGKGCDKIQLLSIREGESHAYYRKEGIHYVPKLGLDELIF